MMTETRKLQDAIQSVKLALAELEIELSDSALQGWADIVSSQSIQVDLRQVMKSLDLHAKRARHIALNIEIAKLRGAA